MVRMSGDGRAVDVCQGRDASALYDNCKKSRMSIIIKVGFVLPIGLLV